MRLWFFPTFLLLLPSLPPAARAAGKDSAAPPSAKTAHELPSGASSTELCGDFSDAHFERLKSQEDAFLEEKQRLHKHVPELATAAEAQANMLRFSQGMRRDVCTQVHGIEAEAEKLLDEKLPDGQCPLYEAMMARLSGTYDRLGKVAASAHEQMKDFTDRDANGMQEDVTAIRALLASGKISTEENVAIHLESFAVWAHGNPGTLLRRFLDGVTYEGAVLKAKMRSLAESYRTLSTRKQKCTTAGARPRAPQKAPPRRPRR